MDYTCRPWKQLIANHIHVSHWVGNCDSREGGSQLKYYEAQQSPCREEVRDRRLGQTSKTSKNKQTTVCVQCDTYNLLNYITYVCP